MELNEQMKKDRDFVLVAVGCHLMNVMTSIDSDYFDDWGHQHFYDLVSNIVDELMFSSPETEYMKSKGSKYYFQDKHNTCLDWYHMDKAVHMVTEDRYRIVAGW